MAEPQRDTFKDEEEHHRVVEELAGIYKPILDLSADGMYIYLDDVHKICNEPLAKIFGYTRDEWSRTYPFLDNFVAPESRENVMRSFNEEIMVKNRSARYGFTGMRKDGTTFEAEVAVVPIVFRGKKLTLNLVKTV